MRLESARRCRLVPLAAVMAALAACGGDDGAGDVGSAASFARR